MLTFFHILFEHIYGVQPSIKQYREVFSHDTVYGHSSEVQPTMKRYVDVLLHDIWAHLAVCCMSCIGWCEGGRNVTTSKLLTMAYYLHLSYLVSAEVPLVVSETAVYTSLIFTED